MGKKTALLCLLATFATLTGGCRSLEEVFALNETVYYDDDALYYDARYDSPGTTVALNNGYMAGDLGNYHGFESEAVFESEQWGGYNAITLHGGSGYWVMTRLDIQGGIDSASLQPGAHQVYEMRSYTGGDETFVTAIGCAGPERNNAEVDVQADRVEVDVEQGEGPNDRVIHFRADYTDSSGTTQVVQGSFDYTVMDGV